MNAKQVLQWIYEPHYGAFRVTDVDLVVAVAIVAAVVLAVWLMRRKKQ